jgi:hypothetical protein
MSENQTRTAQQLIGLSRKLNKLNKPTLVDLTERDTISEYGTRALSRLMHQYSVYPDDNWNWNWNTRQTLDSVTYVGNLTTRLSKLYRLTRGEKMPVRLIEEIGNVASQYRVKAQKRFVQVVWSVEWQAGDFGDEDSCLFNGNDDDDYICGDDGWHWIRDDIAYEIKTEGIGAVCVYYAYKGIDGEYYCGEGFARAWLIQNQPKAGMLLTFNAYGLPHRTLATLFAQALSTEYRLIRTDHYYRPPFYSNEDGAIYGRRTLLQQVCGK